MLRVIDNGPTAVQPQPRSPKYLQTESPIGFGEGFWAEEREEQRFYRWMGLEGTLEIEPRPEESYVELFVFSEFFDLSQEVTAESGSTSRTVPVSHGWHQLSFAVPAGADSLTLRCNKLFPPAYYPEDGRELSIRVSAQRHHSDPKRHEMLVKQHDNRVLNNREMMEGKTVLESTPAALGIDLHGVCNIKPPCVYCDWDVSKEAEGDKVDEPFTMETLQEFGPFYDNSASLVNCSIGEPFMMKHLNELLDEFGDSGKELEITTNGQILTEKNIQKLLGRQIELYISLDAATPETYAKLRNDKLDTILVNLRRLIEAKGGREGYPKVNLVFMPMKCNVHETDAFVRLCADLGVDKLILRPLNYMEGSPLDWERAGHHFIYDQELLDFDHLIHVSGRVAELCKKLGQPLADQMDFGVTGTMEMERLFDKEFKEGRSEIHDEDGNVIGHVRATEAAVEAPPPAEAPVAETPVEEAAPPQELPPLGQEKLPPCLEPWRSYYILRRGVLPCCYGHQPIAPMDDFNESWNSKLMQEIRHDLVNGRFHDYCAKSSAARSCASTRAPSTPCFSTHPGRAQPWLAPAGRPADARLVGQGRLGPAGPGRSAALRASPLAAQVEHRHRPPGSGRSRSAARPG